MVGASVVLPRNLITGEYQVPALVLIGTLLADVRNPSQEFGKRQQLQRYAAIQLSLVSNIMGAVQKERFIGLARMDLDLPIPILSSKTAIWICRW